MTSFVELIFQSELVVVIHCDRMVWMFSSKSSKLSLRQKSWTSWWNIIQKVS